MKDRSYLTTEKRNERSCDIDTCSTLQIVEIINAEDALIAVAVEREKLAIASAVDLIVERFKLGGKLFYVGAGTSGRLGVLDASECPPTFGVSPTMVQGIIAGGYDALVRSAESKEDQSDDGKNEIISRKIGSADIVAGIAASGVTPFVTGALEQASKVGAGTIFITCSPEAVKDVNVDVVINPVVGPEVVTGSTRMKAGTATKLVLNTLTTASMIKLGKVHGNLMVDLKATNAKLIDRAQRIISDITSLTREEAGELLRRADGEVKPAIVMHYRKVNLSAAKQILKENNDSLRTAIEE